MDVLSCFLAQHAAGNLTEFRQHGGVSSAIRICGGATVKLQLQADPVRPWRVPE